MTRFDTVLEIQRVLELEGNAILDTAKKLSDPEIARSWLSSLERVKAALDQGGKIVVTGMGKSGKVAQKIAATLASTGSLAIYLHPTEALHGDLGMIAKSDIILALSHSGNTDEVYSLASWAQTRNIPLLLITGNSNGKINPFATEVIPSKIKEEACPIQLAPTTSTTLSLAIGDALAVCLMKERGFKAEDFAQFHPAGSLGDRLKLKVSDLCHSLDKNPVLKKTATMEEVLTALTQYKLGAVLITEQDHLLGIITDGDIRRALQHKDKFFLFQADQIMTKNPITVQEEQSALDALRLMENRPSQISVVPVLNLEKKPVGILRLHDLLQKL